MNNSKDNKGQSYRVHVGEEGKETKDSNEGKHYFSKSNKKRRHSRDKDSNKKGGLCFNCESDHIKRNLPLNNFVAMIGEAFVVEDEIESWIIRVLQGMCIRIQVSSLPISTEDGKDLYMRNSSASLVRGKENITLEFTSEKRTEFTSQIIMFQHLIN